MDDPLKTFGGISGSLARNPLGIIALFIVLVYAMASVVLGVTSAHLIGIERLILVWFLALFPVLVLGVFGWLVSRHHSKLYSPSDFKDETNYMRLLTAQEQLDRIAEDEKLSLPDQPSNSTSNPNVDESASESLPRPLISTKNQYDAHAMYYLAEDLAMRQLQSELKIPIQRNTAIEGMKNTIGFDGVAITKDTIYVVEVKLIRSATSIRRIIHPIDSVASKVRKILDSHKQTKNLVFIAAIVTEVSEKDFIFISDYINKRNFSIENNIDFRLFQLKDLKHSFGIIADSQE